MPVSEPTLTISNLLKVPQYYSSSEPQNMSEKVFIFKYYSFTVKWIWQGQEVEEYQKRIRGIARNAENR